MSPRPPLETLAAVREEDLASALRSVAMLVTARGVAIAAAALPIGALFDVDAAPQDRPPGANLGFLVGLVRSVPSSYLASARSTRSATPAPRSSCRSSQAVIFRRGRPPPSCWRRPSGCRGGSDSADVDLRSSRRCRRLRRHPAPPSPLRGGGRGWSRRFGVYALAKHPGGRGGGQVCCGCWRLRDLAGMFEARSSRPRRSGGEHPRLSRRAVRGRAPSSRCCGLQQAELPTPRAPEISGISGCCCTTWDPRRSAEG